MFCFRIPHRRERVRCSKSVRSAAPGAVSLLRDAQGAAILEFAIALPLLVVFVVGIYDFSGAFNQKQKIEQAAQEGAIVAGAQPTSDIASPTAPDSLLPVVTAIFNSLVASGVVPSGTCTPPGTVTIHTGVAWTYSISGCSGSLSRRQPDHHDQPRMGIVGVPDTVVRRLQRSGFVSVSLALQ